MVLSVTEKIRPIALALILSAVCLAYWPSLFQIPRADQLMFLYQVNRDQSLPAIIADAYSWNRKYLQGDLLLFKPIHYALLAVQWKIFGQNFFLWQFVGVLYHAMAVILLYLVLRELMADTLVLPELFTFFFAVLTMASEAVTWHHTNAVVLCAAFFLGMLLLVFRAERTGDPRGLKFLPALALLTAFTFEVGLVFVILLTIYLACRCLVTAETEIGLPVPWPVILALVAVVVVYFATSLIDLLARSDFNAALVMLRGGKVQSIPYEFAQLAYWWLKATLLPEAALYIIGARLRVFWTHNDARLIGPTIVALTILGGFIYLLMGAVRKPHSSIYWLRVVFLTTGLVTYVSLILLGRGNERGVDFAFANALHYAYWFDLLLILVVSAFLQEGFSRPAPKPSTWPVFGIFALLTFWVAWQNYVETYDVNLRYKEYYRPHRELFAAIEMALGTHASSSRTFSVEPGCGANERYPWFHNRELVELVYREQWRREGGDVVVRCRSGAHR